jgi:hypothetical protein
MVMDEEEEGTRTMEAKYKGLTAHFASIEPYQSSLHLIHIK